MWEYIELKNGRHRFDFNLYSFDRDLSSSALCWYSYLCDFWIVYSLRWLWHLLPIVVISIIIVVLFLVIVVVVMSCVVSMHAQCATFGQGILSSLRSLSHTHSRVCGKIPSSSFLIHCARSCVLHSMLAYLIVYVCISDSSSISLSLLLVCGDDRIAIP